MSNSYRIRTEVGKDKSIQVYLDQDFEFLEILSLKLLQSEIYTRPCADYGVIVGRISVNNGFGIPNAKVSVFIPLTSADEENPIISDLYPYKTLTSTNEDGYRYNLLPYTRQHGGHTPTGTFFDREDALIDTNIIEVFDKYYKYTAKTNDSGDFMIFGVPLGTQTVHADIDLSDIGEFSLSPQDLIRMGVATPSQVAGTNFKSSTNLSELPQIVTINRVVEVEPLWGQEDLCTIGITRTDIDLSAESNIIINPTAIFMGSLISSNDDQFLKRNCKPKVKQGSLCNLVTGNGQILAIRQTIFTDTEGRPALEFVELEQGGQVIDENGTWMIDVPMNLDYVVTNEFGERVISNDPRVGIPTKAKYRFKVKWNQPPTLKDQIKRGYFLVPNVKEWGWNNSNTDPLAGTTLLPSPNKAAAISSYAFSLDWNDYGPTGTTLGDAMIQEAIDCEDRFYPMVYNKVYTVSQMVDQYRKGRLPNRMVSIKNILDDACESENTKFPTNDAVFRFDIIYLLFVIIMYIFKPILLILLVVVHILAWLLKYILGPILGIIVGIVFGIIILICKGLNPLCFRCLGKCPSFKDLKDLVKTMLNLYKFFTNIKLPNLSYPDCELCDCKEGDAPDESGEDPSGSGINVDEVIEESQLYTVLSPYFVPQLYVDSLSQTPGITDPSTFASILGGQAADPDLPPSAGWAVPQLQFYGAGNFLFTNSLTIAERINLFNTKAKYFDESSDNPGGEVNRIRVKFDYTANTLASQVHYDNVTIISVTPQQLNYFTPGKLISFQDPNKTKDVNITGVTTGNQFNTYSITGTPINISTPNYSLTYANPDGSGNSTVLYNITQDADDANFHKFPIDIEYFQVITGMTCSSFLANCSGSAGLDTFPKRFLNNTTDWNIVDNNSAPVSVSNSINPLSKFKDFATQGIIILVRGVDPNSSRRKNRYDLSYIFGFNSYGNIVIEGDYKFNWPIQGKYKSVSHNDMASDTTNTDTFNGTSQYLYYPSFHFQPATVGFGSFSAFSSNLPSYYSSLDNQIPTYTPSNMISPTTLSTAANTTSVTYGTKVPDNYSIIDRYNGFETHYLPPVIDNNYPPSSNDDTRGYYPKEIVEGGSYFAQKLKIVTVPPSAPIATGVNYSPKYNLNFNFTLNTGTSGRIVMRSDRLPTSNTTTDNGNSSLLLQNNPNFSVFFISDDGTVASVPQSQNTPNFGDQDEQNNVAEDTPLGPTGTNVLETFNCAGMVPLTCYEGQSGTINVLQPPNECYENGSGDQIMQNGCYILVSRILKTLINGRDFKLISEWMSRIQITFAACRNVWSHIFTNSWVNGTLYAFAFKNDRFFTPPSTSPQNPFCPPTGGPCLTRPNAPYSLYCRDTVFLHPTSNFYYRSSPYNGGPGGIGFIGSDAPAPTIGSATNFGGNRYNLKYPTTIMDLGPRNFYQQELSMSDDYDGYIVNNLKDTSYTSVDEILNYLIISRLINQNFLQALLGTNGSNALSYFNERSKQFVDGDYAQLISISSEFGVADFEAANYGGNSLFLSDSNSNDVVIGIFFSSDTENRDYITPKRQIISPTAIGNQPCAFNYFKVFSQQVPFYQWKIENGNNPNSIFGSQKNDWHTSGVDGLSFFSNRYQSLDRIQPSSRYFRPNTNLQNQYFKGHIYSVDASGNISFDRSTWALNNPMDNVITVGDPFHFYFGLKKGATAFDRFARQWINFDVITE